MVTSINSSTVKQIEAEIPKSNPNRRQQAATTVALLPKLAIQTSRLTHQSAAVHHRRALENHGLPDRKGAGMKRYEIKVYANGQFHCWTAIATSELQARMDALALFDGQQATVSARPWRR